MTLSEFDIANLDEVNNLFLAAVEEDAEIPVYRCSPAATAETAFLLSRAGYRCYCPYFYAPVRRNRHSKKRVNMPFLYFSGYLFIIGKSPKEQFPNRVSRLRFADQFATIALSDLAEF